MVLEAVMICMDNSEFQRNGDYSPSRLVAQRETINHIALSKTESNMESTVGLLTMGGRAKVLCAPTRNLGQIMGEIKGVSIHGKCDFLAGIKTAQLALKNRQNKNQHQRIIVFVGSPIDCDMKKLTKLGANLKKNGLAVDVVNFGKENSSNTNTEKLEAFIKAVTNDDNSHLVNIPPGPHILSDMVVSSAILGGGGAQAGGFGAAVASPGGGGANLNNGGGVGGPVGDSEEQMLAYALRISMEEARDAQNKPAEEAKKEENKSEAKKEESKDESSKMELDEVDEDIDEEAELARAMALSMAVDEDDDENAQEDGPSGEVGADDDAILEVFKEEKFIEDLIDSTGVQKDDIDIQKIIDNSEKDENPKDKEEDKGNS
mmetsp:Transcript_25495/g.61412  ORF Transcript_25495/g.61412 Transcript_25495/m.61412 type:complete len:375 (-) Transcript_25495:177-1301(-)